jgi:hypothetical protein
LAPKVARLEFTEVDHTKHKSGIRAMRVGFLSAGRFPFWPWSTAIIFAKDMAAPFGFREKDPVRDEYVHRRFWY